MSLPWEPTRHHLSCHYPGNPQDTTCHFTTLGPHKTPPCHVTTSEPTKHHPVMSLPGIPQNTTLSCHYPGTPQDSTNVSWLRSEKRGRCGESDVTACCATNRDVFLVKPRCLIATRGDHLVTPRFASLISVCRLLLTPLPHPFFSFIFYLFLSFFFPPLPLFFSSPFLLFFIFPRLWRSLPFLFLFLFLVCFFLLFFVFCFCFVSCLFLLSFFLSFFLTVLFFCFLC